MITYLPIIIIAVLGLIDVGAMLWVWRLQQRLHKLSNTPHIEINPTEQAAINQDAVNQFEAVVHQSAETLQGQLSGSAAKIPAEISSVVNRFLEDQLQAYADTIHQSMDQVKQSLGQVNEAVTQQKQALTTETDRVVKAELERRVKALDEHMSDIVASYLIDALGNEVDLGSQTQYLFKLLEEHKAELVQELQSEA